MDEEATTNFEKFLIKYFPLTEDNHYGVIPIIGLAVSFYTAGIFVHVMEICLNVVGWSGFLFTSSVTAFALIQALWGFRASEAKFLNLWLLAKDAEAASGILVVISSLLFYGREWYSTIIPAILNIVLVISMIIVGYGKYKYVKKIQEKNDQVDGDKQLEDVK